MKPKFPKVVVKLTGEDGGAFQMIGRTRATMRKAGVASVDIEAFTTEAHSGDYDNVISTIMKWVTVK